MGKIKSLNFPSLIIKNKINCAIVSFNVLKKIEKVFDCEIYKLTLTNGNIKFPSSKDKKILICFDIRNPASSLLTNNFLAIISDNMFYIFGKKNDLICQIIKHENKKLAFREKLNLNDNIKQAWEEFCD